MRAHANTSTDELEALLSEQNKGDGQSVLSPDTATPSRTGSSLSNGRTFVDSPPSSIGPSSIEQSIPEPVIDPPVKGSRFRKRKESLRKTAILGGRKLGSENREKKAVPLQRSATVPLANKPLPSASVDTRRIPRNPVEDLGQTITHLPEIANLNRVRRQFSYESKEAMISLCG